MGDVTLRRFDYCPWLFWSEATPLQQEAQKAWQEALTSTGHVRLGLHCFVSPLAGIYPTVLELGDESYIAGYAYVTDEVRLGAHSTVNPFAVVRGKVTLGTGVRIGAHTSLLGFTHGIAPDRPVYEQPVTVQGITVGDDVFIGSHAVVRDGVTIGDHAIVGAGAVVTRDVPPHGVVGGNPARLLRDRRIPGPPARLAGASLTNRLVAFGERARAEWPEILARCFAHAPDGTGRYLDRPGADPTHRAWCDAVEIAVMFGHQPPHMARDDIVQRLRAAQDRRTGIFVDTVDPRDQPPGLPAPFATTARYLILAVGYALELLGATFTAPVYVAEELTAEQLYACLARLPWADHAWDCGDWIDAYSTSLYFNLKSFGQQRAPEPLFGWLLTHANRLTGMWGAATSHERWLQPVNGFYRLTRGSYAQFGLPVPYPEAAIDTVLAHSRDRTFFRDDRGNACNVLDVIHPLWLCGLQTDYRRDDVRAWARWQIDRALARWQDGQGFSFALEPDPTARHASSLMGTEMWLSIVYLLAEVCGEAAALGYRPRGVHRLEPGWRLAT